MVTILMKKQNHCSISLRYWIKYYIKNVIPKNRGHINFDIRTGNSKNGKEREISYQKMKRSTDESHTQTPGNLIEIFWQSQMSFSIRRE